MTLDKQRTFQYIKIENAGRRYFCLQQNLATLVWILVFAKNPLRPINRIGSEKKSPRLIIRWLWNTYRLFKRNFIIYVTFISYKYKFQKIGSVAELPFYGQICVFVHQGYKIFDIRRGVVTKVFDHGANSSHILREVEQLKLTSQIGFAPSLKRCNIEERWYEEEYVSGSLDDPHKPLDSEVVLKKFCHDLAQYINHLILFQQPLKKEVGEYVGEIVEGSKSFKHELTDKEFGIVKKYLDAMVKCLSVEGDLQIYLVFTHGDFCPANMLTTRHGLKIVDWEGAMYRSTLFDFYSYFFYRAVVKDVPVDTIASEICEALPIFVSRLAVKAPDISNSLLQSEKVYRWLYYIERVSMLVERKSTDKNLDIMKFISRYIEVFNGYEELLACNE
ncbi:MAG: hypothetical protein SCALA701_02590 [Candidatus Scalindua sp.]|nr:phosphotransferase [Planctomycetota bacterium]GJQ57458.1 MAG: hypothetical protein SCALA701_02590 [Candidatus Scalindua sp.]